LHLSQKGRPSTIRRSKLINQNYGIRNCVYHRRDDRVVCADHRTLPAQRLAKLSTIRSRIDMVAAVKLGNKQLVEKLTRSAIYRDYARAFSDTTGMPIALRPVEHWQPAMRGAANENPFCELMARSNRICAACLEVQRKLTEKIGDRSRTVTCFAGLSDSAVPIRVGDVPLRASHESAIGIRSRGRLSLRCVIGPRLS